MKGIDETLPEVVKNFLRKGAKLENITLHANGRWTHEGSPIENRNVAKAFYRHIDRTQGGTWVIHMAPYTYPIEVEDVGFFVERVSVDGNMLELDLLGETRLELDAAGLVFEEPDRLYIDLPNGYRARFLRSAYNTVMQYLDQDERGYVLDFGEKTYVLKLL